MITFKALGSALQVLRRRRGLTQREVQKRLGWPHHTLSNYEHGRPPSVRRLFALLELFEASLEDLHRALPAALETSAPPALSTASPESGEPKSFAAAEEPAGSPALRAIDELRKVPRPQLGYKLNRFVATMVEKTLREDPQRVLDALEEAVRSGEDG